MEKEASGLSSRSLLAEGRGSYLVKNDPSSWDVTDIEDGDIDSIGIEKVCKFGNLGLLETFTNLFASSKVYF